MQTFVPRVELRNRVQVIEVLDAVDGEVRVLPTSGAVLGLQMEGRVRGRDGLLAPAGITGIQTVPRSYAYVGSTTSILVRFTPQALGCLGVSAAQLADRSVALDDLLAPARVRMLLDQVAAARDWAARVAVVEGLLLELQPICDRVVEHALTLIDGAADITKIANIARAVGLSERQLGRRFLAAVGLSPKRYASLRRFERALALSRTAPSLTAAALAAGYYDQSHFIRDVHRFAGTTPGELFRPPPRHRLNLSDADPAMS